MNMKLALFTPAAVELTTKSHSKKCRKIALLARFYKAPDRFNRRQTECFSLRSCLINNSRKLGGWNRMFRYVGGLATKQTSKKSPSAPKWGWLKCNLHHRNELRFLTNCLEHQDNFAVFHLKQIRPTSYFRLRLCRCPKYAFAKMLLFDANFTVFAIFCSINVT
jgi:hypothetical protein